MGTNLTKGELAEQFTDLKSFDFATPQPWFDAMRKLQANAGGYVWSYDKRPDGSGGIMGYPVNLAEAALPRLEALRHYREACRLAKAEVLPPLEELARLPNLADRVTQAIRELRHFIETAERLEAREIRAAERDATTA